MRRGLEGSLGKAYFWSVARGSGAGTALCLASPGDHVYETRQTRSDFILNFRVYSEFSMDDGVYSSESILDRCKLNAGSVAENN